MNELGHALRGLVRTPTFALMVVLTLALGIGANTAVFSLIHGILLEPLPYADSDRLVVLRQDTGEGTRVGVSIAELADYRAASRSLDLVEHHSMSFILLGRDEPERVSTGVVSHDFFDLLGVRPLVGRAFVAADEQPGAEAVLMLSHGYFRRAFGGDPAIVGQVFEMNDRPHTVVGVLPDVPQFPTEHQVYMPTVACPFRAAGERAMASNRSAFRALTVFGRLGEGATLAGVRAEAATIARRFVDRHPETYAPVQGLVSDVVPLEEELTRGARAMLWMLLATTGLVLLLACANVANLILSRLLGRRRDMAVRAALGAGRWRLARASLVETSMLSLAGGGLGIPVAALGLDLLRTFAAPLSPRAASVDLDAAVLAFAFGLALLTGLAFGSLPVLSRRLDLAAAFRDDGHGATGGAKARLRTALVVAQVAVSTVLLVGAGLLLRSFDRLQRIDPGFDTERVLTARVALNWSKYTDQLASRDFFHRLVARLEGEPGIVSAAVGSVAPLTQQGARNRSVRVEGRPTETGLPDPTADLHFVSPDYFRTLGIDLLRGRVFDARDHDESPPVALVNATTARRLWPGTDPLGSRLSVDGGTSWREVVGVVGDVRSYRLDRQSAEELYLPLAQTGFANRVVVRAEGDPRRLAQMVRKAVYAVDPEQPVERVETLAATRRASLATPRTTTWLLGVFAALALVLTVSGVAGLVSWSVGQRRREIGVRVALGARHADVVAMVLRRGVGMVMVGVAFGLLGAILFARLLAGLLFETRMLDPLTLVSVSALFLVVGLGACLAPAWRAVTIDPNRALRVT